MGSFTNRILHVIRVSDTKARATRLQMQISRDTPRDTRVKTQEGEAPKNWLSCGSRHTQSSEARDRSLLPGSVEGGGSGSPDTSHDRSPHVSQETDSDAREGQHGGQPFNPDTGTRETRTRATASSRTDRTHARTERTAPRVSSDVRISRPAPARARLPLPPLGVRRGFLYISILMMVNAFRSYFF